MPSLASIPGLIQALVKGLNVKGDVPQDLKSLLPSIQLLDLQQPEYVVPALGRLCTGRVSVAAVAGQQGFAHLAENSNGAQVLCVVEAITIVNLSAAVAYYNVGIATVQGVYGTAGGVAFRDGRSPTAVQTTFNPVGGTAAGPPGVAGEKHAVAAGLDKTIVGPWVLVSGGNNTLELVCDANNSAFVASYRFRERPILNSEKFVL